jgi:hypothetical protein
MISNNSIFIVGLSAAFTGIYFLLAIFMTPILVAIPHAGTSPLLITLGAMLFFSGIKKNAIDWNSPTQAYPAYITMFLIPFTVSILNGVIYGWLAYLCIGVFTGDLKIAIADFLLFYIPQLHAIYFGTSDEEKDTVAKMPLAFKIKVSLSIVWRLVVENLCYCLKAEKDVELNILSNHISSSNHISDDLKHNAEL